MAGLPKDFKFPPETSGASTPVTIFAAGGKLYKWLRNEVRVFDYHDPQATWKTARTMATPLYECCSDSEGIVCYLRNAAQGLARINADGYSHFGKITVFPPKGHVQWAADGGYAFFVMPDNTILWRGYGETTKSKEVIALETSLKTSQEEAKTLKGIDAIMKKALQQKYDEVKKVKDELADLRSSTTKTTGELTALEDKLKAAQDEAEELKIRDQEALAAKDAEVKKMKEDIAKLEAHEDALKGNAAKVAALETELEKVKKDNATASSEKSKKLEELEAELSKHKDHDAALEESAKRTVALEDELKRLHDHEAAALLEKSKNIEDLEAQLTKAKQQSENSDNEKIKQLEAEMTKVKAHDAAMSEVATKAKAIQEELSRIKEHDLANQKLLEESYDKLTTRHKDILALQDQLEDAKKHDAADHKELRDAQAQLEKVQAHDAEDHEALNNAKAQLEKAATQFDAERARTKILAERIEELENHDATDHRDLKTAKAELEDTTAKLKDEQAKTKAMAEEMQELKAQNTKLKEDQQKSSNGDQTIPPPTGAIPLPPGAIPLPPGA